MRKWKRVETDRGLRLRSALAPHEAALLKTLVASMIGLLDDRNSSSPPDELEQITGIRTGSTERPDNVTLRRLLPDFYTPDNDDGSDTADSLNAALRSLHEPEIIEAKRAAAQQLLDTVPDDGGRVELTEDAANAWIAALNDVRLALGTMLDIRSDGPERLPDDHPLSPHLDVYQWLTVVQEYLVLALLGPR